MVHSKSANFLDEVDSCIQYYTKEGHEVFNNIKTP